MEAMKMVDIFGLDQLPKHPEWAAISWQVEPVGSRVTCDPAPEDTDEDFLCLVNNSMKDGELLEAAGFSQDGLPKFYTGNDNGGFRSYRRGDTNVITTESMEFFELFMTATHLAKQFNLLKKADRIALFQGVLYGVKHNNLEG